MYRTTPVSKQVYAEMDKTMNGQVNEEQKHQYEMEEPLSSIHTDLRRDLSAYPRAANNTGANLPLFETYQFLNSGKLPW